MYVIDKMTEARRTLKFLLAFSLNVLRFNESIYLQNSNVRKQLHSLSISFLDSVKEITPSSMVPLGGPMGGTTGNKRI